MFARGDVVVTAFPFADGTFSKVRPALVYAGPWDCDGISICWILMITSSQRTRWPHDVGIQDTVTAGLPKTSLVRTLKIACIDTRLIIQKIGFLDSRTAKNVRQAIRKHVS